MAIQGDFQQFAAAITDY